MPTPPCALTTPTAHTPPQPALTTPTAHTTPPPRYYPHLVAFLSVLCVFKGCQCVPTPSAPSPPAPPTPLPGPSPLHRPGSHFLGVKRVFKGCQCVPTPPRALTTPTAHTPSHPGLATTHTWLAFPGCLESILKAANACPHFPAPTHTWLAFPRCLERKKRLPMRALPAPSTPTAHTLSHPSFATTHT